MNLTAQQILEIEDQSYAQPIWVDDKIVALCGVVSVGDTVEWKGRLHGTCSNDGLFVKGLSYSVCFIYPTNFDVELQHPSNPSITIRARHSEVIFKDL